jgi:hypothetical protein
MDGTGDVKKSNVDDGETEEKISIMTNDAIFKGIDETKEFVMDELMAELLTKDKEDKIRKKSSSKKKIEVVVEKDAVKYFDNSF